MLQLGWGSALSLRSWHSRKIGSPSFSSCLANLRLQRGTPTRSPDHPPLPPAAPQYQEVSGTSIAAALVGGAAGLIWAGDALVATTQMSSLRDALLEGADRVPALQQSIGNGQTLVEQGRRLDVYNSLAWYFGLEQLPEELQGKRPSDFGGLRSPSPLPSPRPPPPTKRPPPSPPPPRPRPSPKPRPPVRSTRWQQVLQL